MTDHGTVDCANLTRAKAATMTAAGSRIVTGMRHDIASTAVMTDVRIIDFVDSGHPALLHMWDKRQRCDRAMEYKTYAAGIDVDVHTRQSEDTARPCLNIQG